MSFLDSVVGAVSAELGGGQGQGAQGMMQAAFELIQQHGGVQGLVDKFQQGGLADEVKSWIGTGANLPVSAEQLQQVLGSDTVQQIAGKFGLDTGQLSQGLASVLPQLIDKASPDGTVASNHTDLLQQGIGALMGALGGAKPS